MSNFCFINKYFIVSKSLRYFLWSAKNFVITVKTGSVGKSKNSSLTKAEKLINYYLKYEDKRENIKSAGGEKARSKHTSIKRIIDFMIELDKIYDKKK